MLDEARIGFDNSDYHLHRHILLALQSILTRKYFYLVPEKKIFWKKKINIAMAIPGFLDLPTALYKQDIWYMYILLLCMVDEKEIEIL